MSAEVPIGRPLPIAQRDEEVAVTVEGESSAPHRTALTPVSVRGSVKDLFDLREAIVLEASAHDGEASQRIRARLRVAEVEEPIRRKVGVKHDIPHACLFEPIHRHRTLPQR